MKRNPVTGAGPQHPKVSILMLTYNHARYIAQAITSVIQQKTSFQYELLIADDCSMDQTVTIANCFEQQYPGISVFAAKRNQGMYLNMAQIFYRARGRYIAFLEGDDFWTAPEKLERQVEILEMEPSVSMCFHSVKLMADNNISGSTFPLLSNKYLTVEDLLQENSIPTCSAVFRREALPIIPSWCESLKLLDWPLFLLLAQQGRIRFLPEPLAVYRIHAGGDWSQLAPNRKSERMIQVLRAIKPYIAKKYWHRIDRRISELYEHISWCFEEQRSFDQALAASWRATVAASFLNAQTVGACLRLALRSRMPSNTVIKPTSQ